MINPIILCAARVHAWSTHLQIRGSKNTLMKQTDKYFMIAMIRFAWFKYGFYLWVSICLIQLTELIKLFNLLINRLSWSNCGYRIGAPVNHYSCKRIKAIHYWHWNWKAWWRSRLVTLLCIIGHPLPGAVRFISINWRTKASSGKKRLESYFRPIIENAKRIKEPAVYYWHILSI